MAVEWFETTVMEQAPLQRGFDITQKTTNSGGVPVISSGGISYYTEKGIAKGPGVIIGRKGTLGSVYYSEEDYWPSDTTLWVTDFKENNPKFVYYFYTSLSSLMLKLDVGSSNPTLNRNHLHSRVIKWPKRHIQDKIATILSAFDDKIELNRRMNRTLEQMARALFKSWFVDFDPVRAKMRGEMPEGVEVETAALFPDRLVEVEGREVPEGWDVKGLDEIAEFLNGLALQKFPPLGENDLPIIKIADLRKGNTDGSRFASRKIERKYIVKNGDILFSWSGTLEVVHWGGGEGALNQHLFKVSSKIYPKWFYYYWLLEHLTDFRAIAASKATTMGHIQRSHLGNARVLIPPQSTITRCGDEIERLFESIHMNEIENSSLSLTKSLLLNKLLSGELEVNL